MSLPVLSAARAASGADLVRLFHKTERAWAEHLGEPAQLDAGMAVVAPDLPGVRDANRVLEAAVPPGRAPADAVAEVDAHFAAAATTGIIATGVASPGRPAGRCGEWVLDPSAPPDRTGPLADHLLGLGFAAVPCDVLALGPAAQTAAAPPAGVTILPARAARRHAAALAAEAAAADLPQRGPADTAADRDWPAADWADAHLRHVDDPHVDAVLALSGGRAVGRALVLAVGDVGRIEDVYVSPDARRQGVGRTLLARAVEICARSAFRHVLLGVRPGDAAAVALFASFGFRRVGSIATYRRPPTASA